MAIAAAKRAWMAGIIDLRGRVVYKNNKTRNHTNQVTLYVESVQVAIVNRLSELTGGKTEIKARSRGSKDGWFRHGCDEHCPTAHIHVQPGEFLPAARWTISGSAMSVVLLNLKPYLVQDKGFTEAIDYGLEHMTLWGQGASATIAALQRLHRLGWPMPPIIEEKRPGILKLPSRGKNRNQETSDAESEERGTEEGVPEVPDL